MRLSVILSTYEQPRALELAIWGYASQEPVRGAVPDFDVIVADDGSGPETGERIAALRASTGLEIEHVRHPDEGFRKCAILNRAIVAAEGEYLVIGDGDCVPRADFVATHARLATPGRFLSGGRVRLTRELGDALTPDDVRAGAPFRPGWLSERSGLVRRRDLAKLARSARWAAALDRLTPTRATWNGHNSSAWKADLLAVNGFDERLGYGGEDRELGERLRNYGLRPLQVRHRAVCAHLEHDRGYVDPEERAEIERVRRETRGVPRFLSRFEGWVSGPAWTEHGILKGPRPG